MLQGALAVCSQGILGLITSDGLQDVTYPDGTKGLAYTGIKLSGLNVGEPWCSREPTVVAWVDELLIKGSVL